MREDFGKSIRKLWCLDQKITYLDHAAYGAVSTTVMEKSNSLRKHIESNPGAFIKEELPNAMRNVCTGLGQYLAADGHDIVLVDNATTAMNAVLRSMVFIPGEEVLVTDQIHSSVRKVVEFACHRAGIRLAIAAIPFPSAGRAEIFQAVTQQINPRTRLIILDHITSPRSLVFPLQELIEHCTNEGIEVLIDGAHAPGMLDFKIQDLGASWYIGNCHKWVGSIRGCGFLWVKESLQASIRPTTISTGMGLGYVESFDWPGSKDFTPYLSVIDAIAFRADYGEEAIRDYCTALCLAAAQELADLWHTELGTVEHGACFMQAVRLPIGGWADREGAIALRRRLRNDFGIEAHIVMCILGVETQRSGQ
ncbi:MAG: aminotransferase class V-fold PLP-dependent enzyme [Pseudomonadota bacterium]